MKGSCACGAVGYEMASIDCQLAIAIVVPAGKPMPLLMSPQQGCLESISNGLKAWTH